MELVPVGRVMPPKVLPLVELEMVMVPVGWADGFTHESTVVKVPEVTLVK
jgi:hypothetical protein